MILTTIGLVIFSISTRVTVWRLEKEIKDLRAELSRKSL